MHQHVLLLFALLLMVASTPQPVNRLLGSQLTKTGWWRVATIFSSLFRASLDLNLHLPWHRFEQVLNYHAPEGHCIVGVYSVR